MYWVGYIVCDPLFKIPVGSKPQKAAVSSCVTSPGGVSPQLSSCGDQVGGNLCEMGPPGL